VRIHFTDSNTAVNRIIRIDTVHDAHIREESTQDRDQTGEMIDEVDHTTMLRRHSSMPCRMNSLASTADDWWDEPYVAPLSYHQRRLMHH
jgi:ABC-type antimicrobial peptide transport system ATPase subunit